MTDPAAALPGGSADEARVIVNGEPVEGQDPLFIGTIGDARDFLATLPVEQLAALSIYTPGRIYAPGDLLGDAP